MSLLLAGAALPAAAQQNSPSTFSLPEPTPTPTAAPQGPEDELAGVPIGPRLIRREDETPRAQPAAPAAPASTAESTPASAPTQTPARSASQTAREATPASARAARVQEQRENTAQSRSIDDTAPSLAEQDRTAPQDAADAAEQAALDVSEPALLLGEDRPPIGDDEWVDLAPTGSGIGADGLPRPSISIAPREPFVVKSDRDSAAWLWAILVALVSLLGWMAWRARIRANQPLMIESAVANGVREQLTGQSSGQSSGQSPARVSDAPASKPDPVSPAWKRQLEEAQTPTPAAAPAAPPLESEPTRIDLSLKIVRATRSVMMFSLEYRLTVCNRSDRAVRDLNLHAQLACAQSGVPGGASIALGQPIGTIERIGPQQSHTLEATTQISSRDIVAMRQGKTPLFIPLLHVTLEGAGHQANTRSFVIGSPSQASAAKLHPIPLDTPVGGITGLRANEIRSAELSEPA
ncbi:MAG: hypothetical protein AAFR88_10810 [Pseudomonadota bacterium]